MDTLTATIKSVTDAGHGAWTAVASAPTLDRDREIVDAGALRWTRDRVPVHDRHFGEIVGSGRPYYEGDSLLIDGVFASTGRAQEVRALVKEGHLDAMSIVFMDAQRETVDGVTHIVGGELLAVDFAPIPSNRDARVLVARSLRGADRVVAEARRVAASAERALVDTAIARATSTLAVTKPSPAADAARVVREAEALLRQLGSRRG